MKFYLVLLNLLIGTYVFGQKNDIGIFQNNADIGKPKHTGNASYDANTQEYTLKGSGFNIWFNRDEFQYLYKKIAGDFILTANFSFENLQGNNHKKIGWMVRESTEDNAASMNAVVHGDGLTVLQWREMHGAFMRDPQDEIFFPKLNIQIIQLERNGKKFIMRVAHPGEPLQVVGTHEMTSMPDSVYAGLFISAHDSDHIEEARVWNVRIDKAIANDYDANPQVQKTFSQFRGTLGSRLEIMDVFDGKRKVIHEYEKRFEAPNWLPDNKLLFNQDGYLFTISTEGGIPVKLNTGNATKINNDHGISFNGKMLAISNSRDGMPGGGSSVYILPLTGGEPRLLTDSTPSYWHGWSPNNKDVAYVAQRNGLKIYNIYKMNISDRREVQLTFNENGHVDGPEYSVDGKYIYYNANSSGTMQIWRMHPDGKAKEQLTFDEYNNWFPHISPDGKWIAFISFPLNIEPNSHPSYKPIMLRLMPTVGGAPKVIAYLYGGQGTMNVNSWAPDSRHLAFVSNSE